MTVAVLISLIKNEDNRLLCKKHRMFQPESLENYGLNFFFKLMEFFSAWCDKKIWRKSLIQAC